MLAHTSPTLHPSSSHCAVTTLRVNATDSMHNEFMYGSTVLYSFANVHNYLLSRIRVTQTVMDTLQLSTPLQVNRELCD